MTARVRACSSRGSFRATRRASDIACAAARRRRSSLEPDDRLTVRDLDGGQRAEVTVLGVGTDGLDGLGVARGRRRDASFGRSSARTRTAPPRSSTRVAARGIDPTRATAAVLFGPSTPPGAETTLRAERPLLVVVGRARCGETVVEGGAPASDLELEIARARPLEELEPRLPEPLADPRLDFQVDRASALAYEVKAGEYIQIIDVQGRQCSDFLAFNAGKLQAGQERGLDSTATRSLMGSAYPQPGLYSKFFDHDLEPLVEVVRDTVGRHDTFGLACTAKYYEDMGYFGHVNCSDNFNARARRRTRSSRAGAGRRSTSSTTRRSTPHNAYVLDEPWSRPGDYVLLRAADRSRVPLERVPGRHRRGERLEPDRGARPRLPGQGAVLGGDRAPRDARRRAEADAARRASTRAPRR